METKTNELEKLNLEELKNLSEKNTSDLNLDKWVIETAFKKFQEDNNESKMRDMKLESEIRSIPLRNFSKLEDQNLKERFSDKEIEYFKNKSSETENPILKAIYSDVSWGYDKKDNKYVLQAIDAHLDCCEIFLKNGWSLELASSLKRALNLSVSTGDRESTRKSVEMISKMVPRMVENEMCDASLINAIEPIVEKKKKLKKWGCEPDYSKIVNVIEKGIKCVERKERDYFHMKRGYLNLLLRLWSNDDAKKGKIMIRIAESYEDEGDWKKDNLKDGNFVAAHFYQNAVTTYKLTPNSPEKDEKLKELKVKWRKANEDSEKGYFAYERRIEITDKEREKVLNQYDFTNLTEVFNRMSKDTNLFPSYAQAKEQTSTPDLLDIVSVVKTGDTFYKHINDDDKREAFIKDYYMTNCLIRSQLFLDDIFNSIKEANPSYDKELIKYLSSSDIISDERLKFIKHGISEFLDEDYISSIYILTFQIEGILKDFLKKLDLPTTSHKTDQVQSMMATEILKILKSKKIDDELFKFIEMFLYDNESYNLRNKLGHGFLSVELEKFNVQSLILIIIKLVSLPLK